MANKWKKMRQQIYKKRYDGSLGNCKQKRILKITDRRKIKYKLGLIVKLTINKNYIDLFYYLFQSSFIALSKPVNFI